ILDFSKIEAGRLDLETLDFDLAGLLEDLMATLAVRAQEKSLGLLCALDEGVPSLLKGDPGRLRQILNNLIGNAIKFTRAGEVVLRISKETEDEDAVLLRFSVRDTGIGIPKSKVGILFDKFSQVDASTTRKYGGTGLGLAISKQLAELMGGEIGVESVLGQGSEFWFTARFDRQAAQEEPQAVLPADLRGVRILVVDDSPIAREILASRLTSWNMRPSLSGDGNEALQLLHGALEEGDPFRIALVDMQMPGMDGETFGCCVRADERLRDLRMVILTSMGARGDARRFEQAGFVAYVTKPVRFHEFRMVLALALAERDGKESNRLPITTRHTVREMSRQFADRNGRILIAEDNATNQQVAIGILKKLGLAADVVDNGREAIKALETVPYDLVLMDVQMPDVDGYEATRRIRNPKSAVLNHDIPIIAMTAHALQGDRERCLQAGMNDYITKPISPEALASALETWLPAKTSLEPEQAVLKSPAVSVDTGQKPPVFDMAGMMHRMMNDEELAKIVASGFLEDIPRQIQTLRTALDEGDVSNVKLRTHSIKGAAANVGGEAVRAVASDMESAAKNGDLNAIQARMDELETEFERLRRAITDELFRE
ncbi:MAG: response regulator, partial [Candidatus Hydrogenedentes bacterium]|nr:response regulator [Candidatus Hydrogenedentota bacterium]